MNTDSKSLPQQLCATLNEAQNRLLQSVEHFQMLDSTNTYLLNRSELWQPNRLSLVVADQQSAGRGQRGDRWHSPANGNLYCSYGWVSPLNTWQSDRASLLFGLILAHTLTDLGVELVSIKWPNDLYIHGGKVAGILVEQKIVRDHRLSVIGCGINLTHTQMEPLTNRWIALNQAGYTGSGVELLAELTKQVMAIFLSDNPQLAQRLWATWPQFDGLYGRSCGLLTAAGRYEGIILGISELGHLKLRTATGEHLFASGHIEYVGS